MALLAFFEFFVYRDTWMKYEYEVDKDFTSKLRINIDITVAMRCQFVGADVLDLAETMVASDGLQYEPVIFELSPQQRLWHREDDPTQPLNACRIHGHLYVNKVAGNFHITVGKAIPHPRGHAHLAALVSHETYNFSHRIDHLSFGEEIPGILNPLDGTEKVSAD
ncbi:hypothetical protein cypCar_00050014, partial [Cyprinus carpio]